MRSEATFKNFYDKVMKLAQDLGTEVTEPHPRKISRRTV